MHHRRRENSSANIAGYCLLFILFLILILSFVSTDDNNSNYTYGGAFLLLIVILLFSMTTVYYEYEPDGNDGDRLPDGNQPGEFPGPHKRPQPGTEKLTVYGAQWCGWTKRQVEFLENNNVAFDYVECTEEKNKGICQGVQGFPLLEFGAKKNPGAIIDIGRLKDFMR